MLLKKSILCALLLGMATAGQAQRKVQELGRGVVAVNDGNNVTLTWRRLAQEPESCKYNIYVSSSKDGAYTLLNSAPLSKTNYATTLSKVPYNSYIAVTMLDNGKESEKSKPFLFKNNGLRNIFMEIRFDKSPLKKANYTTKFVWPCDLNGDGEYDYVVDRCPTDGSRNFYLEGYLADGTFLWNVDLGVNERPCDGQNDNLCAYDIDCDGKGEVIVQTSDGTRFWDKEKGTWGKYLFGKDTGDSDGDGIIDYDTQETKNPPRYMTVIDGMTGTEKASAEFAYDEAYNRTNKGSLMGDEYNKHEGHTGIFYHDGVHPAIVGEWHTRSKEGEHYYRNVAFAYQGGAWKLLFSKQTGGAVFHQIRIADVDGDGCDEMLSGAYAMDQDGSTLYNSGIGHGDRHRISDIDPDRPGLECFAIQQYAPDMLGQILYDAATGEPIKKWYLNEVGDVGRGECMDVDPNHLGWEMWSTMDGVYDAKGDRIDGLNKTYPTEGIWWDGQLDREIVQSSDSHYNVYIMKFDGTRLVQPAKESGYQLITSYGKRAKFWGDIIGDWREEMVLIMQVDGVCQGIVGLSTSSTTDVNNIYCLQQDPHYRGDCTTRGYYQSPNPGFYLGYGMPRPQLPPVMQANEECDVFGIADGNATATPRDGLKNIYMMPVKKQNLTLRGLKGNAQLWKSQQGTLTLEGKNESTGNTIVSEGTLNLQGDIAGTVDLRARGTLSGNGSVGGIMVEGALNYEGCRIMPSKVITVNNTLTLDKKTYMEINTDDSAFVKVNGDLAITAPVVFTIRATDIKAGTYKLIEYTGQFSGSTDNFSVRGLTGLSCNVINKDRAIYLSVADQREPTDQVVWTGKNGNVWDYRADNFSLDGTDTSFATGDGVVFNDDASATTVKVDELMSAGSVTFENDSKAIVITGNGGISGAANVTVNGTGRVLLNATKSDYTGKTTVNSGTLVVKQLADAGTASSIGAATAAASNFLIGKATLQINNANTATNRGLTLTDTATIQVSSGTTALKGIIVGKGVLRKTGGGQLNITYSGNNTWAGTILAGGTLAMGAYNTTFGLPTSTIHVTANSTLTLFDTTQSSNAPTLLNTILIDEGKTLNFKAGSRCHIRGALKGKGTYKVSFPYVRGDVYTNTSGFEGTYQVTTSKCRFVQGMDLSKATLKLDQGSYAAGFKAGKSDEANYTHKIGTLTGTGTLGTGTWQISRLLVNYRTTSTAASCDAVTINGTAVLDSPVIDMRRLSGSYIPGNAEFAVIKGDGHRIVKGNVTILPATPRVGYEWDTSRLASDGVITITKSATGIDGTRADGNTNTAMYDLQGRKVRKASRGVYIVNKKKILVNR